MAYPQMQDGPNPRQPTRTDDETRPAETSGSNGGSSNGPARAGLGESEAPLPQLDAFSGYQIIHELSKGGQGVVYEALQKTTKRKVAVKVLLEGPYATASARRRFEREIELATQLKHPNIVSIFDAGRTADGCPFYVMEYVRGTPLTAYVRAKNLSLPEALRLFAKACWAIQYAHQRGIIHRDLKPSHVLVDAAGEVKILDFGLAKWLAAPADMLLSLSQHVMGTLPYMSPEQTRGNPDEVDTRTDVYSLGVILYELLTGSYPYSVVGPMGLVLHAIAEKQPTPPSRAWTADLGISPRATRHRSFLASWFSRSAVSPIDDVIETIVLKTLAKDCQRRYQTAGELARDIGHYLAGEPVEAIDSSGWYLLTATIKRYRRALVMLTSLTVLLVISVALIVLVSFQAALDLRQCTDAQANLRALGQGLLIYHRTYSEYPSTLDQLVFAGFCTPRQLIAVREPSDVPGTSAPFRSQFVYHPGAGHWSSDDQLILAYECDDLVRGRRWFARGAPRRVLFASLDLRWMPEKDFQAAARADRARRKAIGWPTGSDVGGP